MLKKIRGLEDHETQDQKRLLRDVRSPVEKAADVLKSGTVQIGGICGAGVCLFAFPFLSLPFFFARRSILYYAVRLRFWGTPAVSYAHRPVGDG